MTDAACRDVAAGYVRSIADLLGLRDWRLDVLDDPPSEDDAYATVFVMAEKRHADVRLCLGWGTLPADVRRETLVHEMLHCHLGQVTVLAEDVREQLAASAWDLWHTAFHRQVELAVDALAHAVAPFLPPYPA